MNNNIEILIAFTEIDGFDKDQKLNSDLYPYPSMKYSLLELCCYHGAIDCFKFLRTEFKSEITDVCLRFSFLGRSKEILSECLKYRKPDINCMKYAIISHNIDFVTFLMNEYGLEINLESCTQFNNIEPFLVYFDQNHDVYKCLAYSPNFNIPSFCEYFLSYCPHVNIIVNGLTALQRASCDNCKEIAELLISHGANINETGNNEKTALYYATLNNCKETAEVLISHGAIIDYKDRYGRTALHNAAMTNNKEIALLLISHGANINEKDYHGDTALDVARCFNSKEVAEFLISHDANINDSKNSHTSRQHSKRVTFCHI